jgi:hypothetical protein
MATAAVAPRVFSLSTHKRRFKIDEVLMGVKHHSFSIAALFKFSPLAYQKKKNYVLEITNFTFLV